MSLTKLNQDLAVAKVENVQFQANHLAFNPKATYLEWETIGKFLHVLGNNVHWWVGDWLLYGEGKFGEMYAQALSATGYSYSSLTKMKYVAKRFSKHRRRTGINWSVYRDLAPLSDATQEIILDKVAAGEFFDRARLKPVVEKTCPNCGHPLTRA